jgi:hypothetical protein
MLAIGVLEVTAFAGAPAVGRPVAARMETISDLKTLANDLNPSEPLCLAHRSLRKQHVLHIASRSLPTLTCHVLARCTQLSGTGTR